MPSIAILLHCYEQYIRATTQCPIDNVAINLAFVAVFYLLCPGKYCMSRDNTPLQLKDVTLLIGQRKLDLLHFPLHN